MKQGNKHFTQGRLVSTSPFCPSLREGEPELMRVCASGDDVFLSPFRRDFNRQSSYYLQHVEINPWIKLKEGDVFEVTPGKKQGVTRKRPSIIFAATQITRTNIVSLPTRRHMAQDTVKPKEEAIVLG